MNLATNNRKKKNSDHFIFRGKSNKSVKSQTRILIEAFIMLAVGVNLLVFLYTLPGEFILDRFLQETWFEFSQGVIQLTESISKIGGALIVLVLILLGFILIIGSLIRLIKISFRYSKKRNRIRKV